MWFTASTGKSSLVKQFIEVRSFSIFPCIPKEEDSHEFQNHFVDAYYPTIESTFAKSVKYKGVEYDCHIIDTAGQVRRLPLSVFRATCCISITG